MAKSGLCTFIFMVRAIASFSNFTTSLTIGEETGGGFVGGSAGMDALWLRSIVKELGVVVADADYRLAPEFPAPIPGNDAWAVFNFVRIEDFLISEETNSTGPYRSFLLQLDYVVMLREL